MSTLNSKEGQESTTRTTGTSSLVFLSPPTDDVLGTFYGQKGTNPFNSLTGKSPRVSSVPIHRRSRQPSGNSILEMDQFIPVRQQKTERILRKGKQCQLDAETKVDIPNVVSDDVLARFHRNISERNALHSPLFTNEDASRTARSASGTVMNRTLNNTADISSPPRSQIRTQQSLPCVQIECQTVGSSSGDHSPRVFNANVISSCRSSCNLSPREEAVAIVGEGNGPGFTVLDYMLERPKPNIPSRSLYCPLYAMFIAAAVVPCLCIIIIFAVNYWATSEVVADALVFETYTQRTECGVNFFERKHRRVGPLSKELFTLLMGIIISIIVVCIAIFLLLYLISWRYMFKPYAEVLEFIRGVEPKLTQLQPLNRTDLLTAPKYRKVPFFCCGKKKGESIITGLVNEVVTLGSTLEKLKHYVPPTKRTGALGRLFLSNGSTFIPISPSNNDDITPICSSQICLTRRRGISANNTPFEEGLNSEAPRNDNPLNGNSIVTHTQQSSPEKRKTEESSPKNAMISCEEVRFPELSTRLVVTDMDRNNTSPRRTPLYSNVPLSQRIFNSSVSLSSALFLRTQTVKERTLSDAGESHSVMFNDMDYLSQQVTFFVCRLFLPKMKTSPDGTMSADSIARAQKMSRLFLQVVLRIAKEEHGTPFNIRMDSVIITFHTPSRPNSLNLVQPRDCALRLASELAKQEAAWSNVSSTPFEWGISMHLSQIVVWVSGSENSEIFVVFGEEINLAYRVADLCRILNCPLLMLQPCYDVFRVCMTGVPVDVIWKKTSEGNTHVCIYELKFGSEDLYAGRRRYAPLGDAFMLMCDKMFEEAAHRLKDILDLDHNARRLHRLCTYFAQKQREGTLSDVLPRDSKYARSAPAWQFLEQKANIYLDSSWVNRSNGNVIESATSDSSFTCAETVVGAGEHNGTISDGSVFDTSFSHSQIVSGDDLDVVTDVEHGKGDNSKTDNFNTTLPPPLPTYALNVSREVSASFREFRHAASVFTEAPDVQDISIRHSQRTQPLSGLYSDADAQEISIRHGQRLAGVSAILSDADEDWSNGFRNRADSIASISNLCSMRDVITPGRLEFDIYEAIGKGSSGVVYRGFHPDGNLVAIKEYPVPNVDEDNPHIKNVRYEVDMLAGCRHGNIVRYINSCFQDGSLFIITEFVSGGSLSALVRTFHGLPRDIIRRYTGDILRGLQYLHERNIVHRDISPNNVLVSIDGVCKLSDFGGAVKCAMQRRSLTATGNFNYGNHLDSVKSGYVSIEEREMMTGAVLVGSVFGTPVCMSPQACAGVVDPKNDIWGLGITLCFCFTGRYPWRDEDMQDNIRFINKIREGSVSPTLPRDIMDSEAADFIDKCLRRDSVSRPNAAELLFHPFMVN